MNAYRISLLLLFIFAAILQAPRLSIQDQAKNLTTACRAMLRDEAKFFFNDAVKKDRDALRATLKNKVEALKRSAHCTETDKIFVQECLTAIQTPFPPKEIEVTATKPSPSYKGTTPPSHKPHQFKKPAATTKDYSIEELVQKQCVALKQIFIQDSPALSPQKANELLKSYKSLVEGLQALKACEDALDDKDMATIDTYIEKAQKHAKNTHFYRRSEPATEEADGCAAATYVGSIAHAEDTRPRADATDDEHKALSSRERTEHSRRSSPKLLSEEEIFTTKIMSCKKSDIRWANDLATLTENLLTRYSDATTQSTYPQTPALIETIKKWFTIDYEIFSNDAVSEYPPLQETLERFIAIINLHEHEQDTYDRVLSPEYQHTPYDTFFYTSYRDIHKTFKNSLIRGGKQLYKEEVERLETSPEVPNFFVPTKKYNISILGTHEYIATLCDGLERMPAFFHPQGYYIINPTAEKNSVPRVYSVFVYSDIEQPIITEIQNCKIDGDAE